MAIIQNKIIGKTGIRATRAPSSKAAINSNLVVCQPYIKPANFVAPADHPDIMATLSHLSLVHYNNERVLTNFKGQSSSSKDHGLVH